MKKLNGFDLVCFSFVS